MAVQSQHVDSAWSWVILLAASVIIFLWNGLLKTLSVLLPTLKDQFETHTWVIGVMVTTTFNVRDFSGPVIGVLASTVSNRLLGMVGGIIIAFSLACASFTDDLLILWLLLAILNGIGFSLLMTPSYALLAQYFDVYYPLASGVFYSCAAMGLMVLAPLSQILLTTYGWRNTLLLLGALNFHLPICAALFRVPPVSESEEDLISTNNVLFSFSSCEEEYSFDKNESFGWMSETKQSGKRLDKLLDLSGILLIKNRTFVAVSVLMASIATTYSVWVVYFIPHCVAKGLTLREASLLGTAAGFAYFIGHIIYIPFISGELYTVKIAIYVSGTVAVIGLFMDPFTDTIPSIYISNALFVLGIGAAWPLCDVFMKSVVGPDMFAKAFGWRLGISGILRYLPSFLVGWIFDSTGSYDIGFMFLGVVQALGVLAVAIDHLSNQEDARTSGIYNAQNDGF